MRIKLLITILAITSLSLNAQNPGGVSSNLGIWFKADASDMDLTSGGRVREWDDVKNVSGVAMVEGEGDKGKRPSLNTTGNAKSNWMPWVEFITGSEAEGMEDTSTPELVGNNGYIFMVNQTISNGSQVCFRGSSDYQMKTSRVSWEGSSGYQIFYSDADNAKPLAVDKNTQPLIITCMRGGSPYLRRNGNLRTVATNNSGAGVGSGLTFGYRGSPATEWSQMNLMEVIIYNGALTSSQLSRIESYLAIKYGTTLGANGTSVNYLASGGNTVWDATTDPGYNYDIAGLARDNNSDLLVEKSHSINNTNPTPSGNYNDILICINQLAADNNYAIWGHNGGNLGNSPSSFTTTNGEDIQNTLNRKWKIRETTVTGFDATTLEFDMRDAVHNDDLSAIRLLIDSDDDFTTGVTSIAPSSFNNTTKLLTFIHDFPHTLNAGQTSFFTLGTVDAELALPLDLLSFTGRSGIKSNILEWKTTAEDNVSHIEIQRMNEDGRFEKIGKKGSIGHDALDEINTYIFEDETPYNISYYRLKIIDLDDSYEYSNNISIKRENNNSYLNIFPNPVKDKLNIEFNNPEGGTVSIELIDMNGKTIFQKNHKETGKGMITSTINIPSSYHGYFIIQITSNGQLITERVLK